MTATDPLHLLRAMIRKTGSGSVELPRASSPRRWPCGAPSPRRKNSATRAPWIPRATRYRWRSEALPPPPSPEMLAWSSSGVRVSVLVFAGPTFHELHEPLSEAGLERSYHPQCRTTDHHARRDRDGQERGVCHFVIHVARFAAALCRQDVTQGFGRKRRLLEWENPREREVLGEHEGLGQLRAGMFGLFFKALLEPSQELLDVIRDQARGQAARHAAERHVSDAQQPQHFEGPIRAFEQVRAASERTRWDRDDVGCQVRCGVRDRSLVYLRDVAGRLETMPVFHTR